MISLLPTQIKALRMLSRYWCYFSELRDEADVTDDGFHQLMQSGYVELYRHSNDKYAITDTGRLALEEFEGAQAVNADASPVVSDAAKIAALEAENAALRGLLAKALDAIESDIDMINQFENSREISLTTFVYQYCDDELMLENLRNIATIAADIRAALDPTTPYENTPDGSDYMATACTQCGKSNTDCLCGADDDE